MPYSREIQTTRYLYHLTYKRNRISIKKNGLKAGTNKGIGFKNAVFAHNSKLITLNWYPIVLDHYEWEEFEGVFYTMDDYLIYCIQQTYDIWEIDTYLLNRKWFIDGVGENDFKSRIDKIDDLYVMTYGDIPLSAIKLCEMATFDLLYNNNICRIRKINYNHEDYVDLRELDCENEEEEELSRQEVIQTNLNRMKYIPHGRFKEYELDVDVEVKMCA